MERRIVFEAVLLNPSRNKFFFFFFGAVALFLCIYMKQKVHATSFVALLLITVCDDPLDHVMCRHSHSESVYLFWKLQASGLFE